MLLKKLQVLRREKRRQGTLKAFDDVEAKIAKDMVLLSD